MAHVEKTQPVPSFCRNINCHIHSQLSTNQFCTYCYRPSHFSGLVATLVEPNFNNCTWDSSICLTQSLLGEGSGNNVHINNLVSVVNSRARAPPFPKSWLRPCVKIRTGLSHTSCLTSGFACTVAASRLSCKWVYPRTCTGKAPNSDSFTNCWFPLTPSVFQQPVKSFFMGLTLVYVCVCVCVCVCMRMWAVGSFRYIHGKSVLRHSWSSGTW